MDTNERYQRAQARVKQLRDFYTHAGVYVCVNIFLLALNLLTSPHVLWFYWPLLGWGIGLALHAFTVFGTDVILGKEWEEKKIREIMEHEHVSEHEPVSLEEHLIP